MDPNVVQALMQQAAAAETRLAQIESKLMGECTCVLKLRTAAASAAAMPVLLPCLSSLASCCGHVAAGGGLSQATVADLHELRALLVEAKTENEQLRAERNEVSA